MSELNEFEVPMQNLARARIVHALIAALEQAEDGATMVSSLRIANLCGLSWGGNHGTAQALRRLTGVQA